MARRGGRKRKLDIRRQPNGQPSRAKECVGSMIPDEAITRRAEATGRERSELARFVQRLAHEGKTNEQIAKAIDEAGLSPDHFSKTTADVVRELRKADQMLCESVRRVDASSALGILHQRGILTVQHCDAGLMLARAHRRWAMSAMAKPRTAKVAGIFGPDDRPAPREVEAEEWGRIKARWDGAKASVPRGLCWALVECVALDNVVAPNMVDRGELCDKIRAELVLGMDALCRFFNIAIPEKGDTKAA